MPLYTQPKNVSAVQHTRYNLRLWRVIFVTTTYRRGEYAIVYTT